MEEKSTKENLPIVPPAGTLIAEPYSWKSLVTGQPILRIKTTGIKGAVLTLPAGLAWIDVFYLDNYSVSPENENNL